MKSNASKTYKLIKNMSLNELQILKAKYCQPHRTLLAINKFGFVLHWKTVNDLINDIVIDKILLNNFNNDLK